MYGGPLSKCWKDTQRNFLIEIRHIQDVWRDADIALLHHECLNQVTDRNLLSGRSTVQGELLLPRVHLVPVLRLFEGMAKAF